VWVDIDKTLVKIDEVASNQEGIAVEEALILRGQAAILCFARNGVNDSHFSPQTGQLETYREALERLNATIAFKSSEVDMEDTVKSSPSFHSSLPNFLVGPPHRNRGQEAHPALHQACR
jgi:hypothetical protein